MIWTADRLIMTSFKVFLERALRFGRGPYLKDVRRGHEDVASLMLQKIIDRNI